MSGWDCTICTFYNKNSAFKCKMCGASRGTSTRQARCRAYCDRINFTVFNSTRLPDQPLLQLEPPPKKAKSSKPRVVAPGKSVARLEAKPSKNVGHTSSHSIDRKGSSLQSAAGTSPRDQFTSHLIDSRGSSLQSAAGISPRDCIQIDGNAASASSSGTAQKQRMEVEKVIVQQPVYNGDIRTGRYIPQWDPYVMVETVTNVRLFPNNAILDREAYTTPLITNRASMTNGPTLHRNIHTAITKGESTQQNVKAKGHSKKGTILYSHSGKEKGPQKGKMFISKGKKSYPKNKDEQSSDVSSSHCRSKPVDSKEVNKQTSKQLMKTTSSSRGESCRQKRQCEESSRPHSSQRTWPTIPNLDYASGERLQVTFNNETVFITQYKLLK